MDVEIFLLFLGRAQGVEMAVFFGSIGFKLKKDSKKVDRSTCGDALQNYLLISLLTTPLD